MRHLYPDVVLGGMVRKLRLDGGLGVAELATQMAWPEKRLRSLEEGAAGVSVADFIPLVRRFGLDLEEFACDFLTNLEEGHVDFRQLEHELDLEFAAAGSDEEYFPHG